MRCHNCKYFTTYKFTHRNLIEIEDDGSDFGVCLHEKIYSDGVGSYMKRAYPTSKDAIVSTCDEERAGLDVGRDFGCIHFENKEGCITKSKFQIRLEELAKERGLKIP
jgi:hypothetical protein